MRVPSWTAILSVAMCLGLAASDAMAQTGAPGFVPAGGTMPFGPVTGPAPVVNAGFVGRGGWQQGNQGHDPIVQTQGTSLPPDVGPWPAISPFENGGQRHQVIDDLWYQETEPRGRRYFSRVTATFMTVRSPKQQIVLIGNPDIATAGNDDEFADLTTLDTRVFEDDPNPLGDTFFNGIVNQHRDTIQHTPGMRVVFGWIDPSDSAIELNGWFSPKARASYKRGQGNPEGTIDPSQPDWHSIALETSAPNSIVGFDQLYRVQFESVYAGGGVNFLSNDVWPSEQYGLRMLWGARYIFVREEFGFQGFDSGDDVAFAAPFEQRLNSTVRSNLAGPQIGADYSVGGEGLKFKGQSKIGLLFNVTEYEIGGHGIGDPNLAGYDPFLNFNDAEKHTHLTPVFEQSLGFEMDVVGFIPILNRISIFDEARVHAGYWVVFLWEVARPTNVIDWRGQPLQPELLPHLADKRGQWYTHGWDIGLTCRW